MARIIKHWQICAYNVNAFFCPATGSSYKYIEDGRSCTGATLVVKPSGNQSARGGGVMVFL
ncbi:MAG: hypothetical protein WAK60_11940 [Sedimentisphaerales bacterium]